MERIKWSWFSASRFGKGLFVLILGIILIFGKEGLISSKTLGIILVILSILFLIEEVITHIKIKKSKKSGEITDISHSQIASYLEKNNIKYIYKPKEEKLFDFFLPEYEVYIKYWEENFSKREELIKYSKKRELKFVEIFYDKLSPISLLHSSFMKKLSEQLKKK